jgi:hypothetical protein
MPKKFKDLAELTQAIDQKAALEDAHILVERIASMGYQSPEVMLDGLAIVAAILDGIAEKLAIDQQAKRVAKEFYARAVKWLKSDDGVGVTLKPVGGDRILIGFRDAMEDYEFETTIRYLLPHLGRALIGEVPPDLMAE